MNWIENIYLTDICLLFDLPCYESLDDYLTFWEINGWGKKNEAA